MGWIECFWRVRLSERNDGFVAWSNVRQWEESDYVTAVSADGIRSLSAGVVQGKLFFTIGLVGHQSLGVWNNVVRNWTNESISERISTRVNSGSRAEQLTIVGSI